MCPLNALGPQKNESKMNLSLFVLNVIILFSIFTKLFPNNLHNLNFILWVSPMALLQWLIKDGLNYLIFNNQIDI
jgi:hypothetical protein